MRNKKLKYSKIAVFALCALLAFSVLSMLLQSGIFAYAAENDFSEEKSYCTATFEDDFADNRVLVALNKTATMKYKRYTTEDFAEIGCISVEDMTGTTGEIVKQQIAAKNTGNWRELQKRQSNKCLWIQMRLGRFYALSYRKGAKKMFFVRLDCLNNVTMYFWQIRIIL